MLKINNKLFLEILSTVFLIQFCFSVTSVYAWPPEAAPPDILNITVSGITSNSVSISWNTNYPTDSLVEYGTPTDYVSGTTLNASSASMVLSHSQTLTGLTENTLYSYRVKSKDGAGNLGVSPYFTFVTSSLSGSSLTISDVTASSITTTGATITWNTTKIGTFGLKSQSSDTQVEYGTTASYGQSTTLNTLMVSNHSQTLSGLSPNTLYHYRVKSKDSGGSFAVSQDLTLTTLSSGGTPPIITITPPIILPPATVTTPPANGITTLPSTGVTSTPANSITTPPATGIMPTPVSAQQPSSQISFILLKGPFSIGQRGEEVKNLQTMLSQDRTIYPEGIITSYYGSLTIKAVQRFQEKYNISGPGRPGYGIAGPKTRTKLNELYGSKAIGTSLSEDTKAKIKLIQDQIAQLMTQLIQMLQEEVKKKGA